MTKNAWKETLLEIYTGLSDLVKREPVFFLNVAIAILLITIILIQQ